MSNLGEASASTHAPSAGRLVALSRRASTELTGSLSLPWAHQQQAPCLQPAGVTPTLCPSCRRHLDLCWQWRSEEPDRAVLDRALGMEGLTSAAAFAGNESAGGR